MKRIDEAVVIALLPSQLVRICEGEDVTALEDAPDSETGKVECKFVTSTAKEHHSDAHPTYTPVFSSNTMRSVVGGGVVGYTDPNTGLKLYVQKLSPSEENLCERYSEREELEFDVKLREVFQPHDDGVNLPRSPETAWQEQME
jgi:hypothetical protein